MRVGSFSCGNRLTESHQFLLPYRQAVEPADTLVDGGGPYLSIGGGLEVEKCLSALDGETFVGSASQDGDVVLVAVA